MEYDVDTSFVSNTFWFFCFNLASFVRQLFYLGNYLFIIFVNCQAIMKFPMDYPYSPPSVRFLCKMWHPNIYEVCNFNSLRFHSYFRFNLYYRISVAVFDFFVYIDV